MLTATALPQQFAISGFEEVLKPLLDLIAIQTSTIVAQTSTIVALEAKVAALDDSIKKLQDDVIANTVATNAAVAAMAGGTSGVTQAQLDALAKVAVDLEANTAHLVSGTPVTPPAVP